MTKPRQLTTEVVAAGGLAQGALALAKKHLTPKAMLDKAISSELQKKEAETRATKKSMKAPKMQQIAECLWEAKKQKQGTFDFDKDDPHAPDKPKVPPKWKKGDPHPAKKPTPKHPTGNWETEGPDVETKLKVPKIDPASQKKVDDMWKSSPSNPDNYKKKGMTSSRSAVGKTPARRDQAVAAKAKKKEAPKKPKPLSKPTAQEKADAKRAGKISGISDREKFYASRGGRGMHRAGKVGKYTGKVLGKAGSIAGKGLVGAVVGGAYLGGKAIGAAGRVTGKAVGGTAKGIGRAVGGVAKGAGRAVGGVARAGGDVVKGAGSAAGGVARGAGHAIGGVSKSGRKILTKTGSGIGRMAGIIYRGSGAERH